MGKYVVFTVFFYFFKVCQYFWIFRGRVYDMTPPPTIFGGGGSPPNRPRSPPMMPMLLFFNILFEQRSQLHHIICINIGNFLSFLIMALKSPMHCRIFYWRVLVWIEMHAYINLHKIHLMKLFIPNLRSNIILPPIQ